MSFSWLLGKETAGIALPVPVVTLVLAFFGVLARPGAACVFVDGCDGESESIKI